MCIDKATELMPWIIEEQLQGNGLVVSTPYAVAGSIPAFSTCLFPVVPRVPGGAAEEKTVPVVPYGWTKPVLIVSIENVGTSAIIG